MKSHGRARKNEANSRENSRDREFSLVSALFLLCPPLSSVCVTKNLGHLKGGSRSLGKYRSSSSALSQPANDEYENFGRIGDGEYVMVN